MYDELKKRIIRKMGYDTTELNKSEERYVVTWKEKYKLKDDIIIEAFTRAINKKGKNITFAYIDAILKKWSDKGVKNYSDILALDEEYRKNKYGEKNVSRKKSTETIKIKYHSNKIEKLRYVDGQTDWVDLRAAEDVSLKKGETAFISLGISVKLPEGYEMIIAPRASTYKNFGIIQINSIGIISEKDYGDILKMPVKAERDTEIHINNRICQFRIIRHQPALIFEEVENLNK